MAAISDQLLTLFDPTNAHQHYERTLNWRVFIRFWESGPCVSHVNNRSVASRREVYFFLPADSTDLIARSVPFYNNILFRIYCPDLHSEQCKKDEFAQQAGCQIFTVNRLSFRLRQAEVEILYELSQQAPNQSDELLTAVYGQLTELQEEFRQHMHVQLG